MQIKTAEINRVLWYFLRPYKGRLAVLLGLMFLLGLVETVNLAVIYPIINYGLEIENRSLIIHIFDTMIALLGGGEAYFLYACILLLVISFFAAAFKYVFSIYSYRLMVRVVGDTQKAVFDKYLQADYNYYVSSQQGKLIHTATIAPEHVFNMVLFAIRGASDLITALTLFGMLMVLSLYGTLALVVAGVLYMVYIRRINEKIIYTSANLGNQADRRKNVVMNEFITGIKPIRVFLGSDFWKGKYTGCVEEKLRHSYRMLMGRVIPEMTTRVVFFLIVGVTGIVLSFRSHAEVVTALPVLGTFILVANRFIPTVNTFGSSLMSIMSALPNARIIYDLLNTRFDMPATQGKKLNGFQECIEFADVAFKYPSTDRRLLEALSFQIRKKQMTAVVGPSGAGKSTIVNLLLKLYRPESGQVLIDGIDIFEYDNHSYLSKIGYVSQETFIFNDTISENIRFGMEDCSAAMVAEAARLAHAHDFIENMKDGYDTLVGDAGVMLSGGQRQRISIARGMLRKPEIMVLDEATSSLDNISERKVQEAIASISEHTTVFVIAHRLSTIQNADCILVMQAGAIAEFGTHSELMQRAGLYSKLYQSEGNPEPDARN